LIIPIPKAVMKYTIAVIGTGNPVINKYVKLISKEKHRILLYSDNQEEAMKLLEEIKSGIDSADAEVLACKVDASWESDIIFFALPVEQSGEAIINMRQVVCRKIIVAPDKDTAVKLKLLLPDSVVETITEFNNLFAV
jgi:8-hydroxy-5-deazaflavin:NADPH oxidoreductase